MRHSTLSRVASNINQERDDLRRELYADLLAWMNDDADNDRADYPGEGWQAEDGPAPSWDAEPAEPHPLDAAYWLGYQLGFEGEYPRVPAHFTGREAHHFHCGRLAGFVDSAEGRAWYADMEALEDRPAARHDDEEVEAIGVIESRKTN